MILGTLAAQAQFPGLRISDPGIEVSGGTVNVRMHIEAEKLDIACNGSYRLVPFIEKDSVRLQLPEVVYAGSHRYRFDRRREQLSGQLVSEVYRVFPKANRQKPEAVDYAVSVPFLQWMEGARVKYEWLCYACEGEQLLAAETLAMPLPESVYGYAAAPPAGAYRHLPDPKIYGDVVFYAPEQERYRDAETQQLVSGKRRSVSADLYISFPQDVPDILPDYKENAAELKKVDSLMSYILGNDLMSAVELTITGHASPEGAYWRNTNLSRYRANNLHRYVTAHYDIAGLPVSVNWIPVDWEGLKSMLAESDIPAKEEILQVIDDIPGDEERERIIARIDGGASHRRMLWEIYPRLRRTVLRADFTVAGLADERAQEVLDTKPELLSLAEMYAVARHYAPGSDDYLEVFELAAREFPGDFVANNNAAAAFLQRGDAEGAYKYIVKIAHDPRAYSNIGTYYYLLGEMEEAGKYFALGAEHGIPGARERLKMVEEKQ